MQTVNVSVSGVPDIFNCDAMAAKLAGRADVALRSCDRVVTDASLTSTLAPPANATVIAMQAGEAQRTEAASGSWLIVVPILLFGCIAMCVCVFCLVFCKRRKATPPERSGDVPDEETAPPPPSATAWPPAPTPPRLPPTARPGPPPSPPQPPLSEPPPLPPEVPRIGGSVGESAADPPGVPTFVAKDDAPKVASPGDAAPLRPDLPLDVQAQRRVDERPAEARPPPPLHCHPILRVVDDAPAAASGLCSAAPGVAADVEDAARDTERSSRGGAAGAVGGSDADRSPDRTDAEGEGRAVALQ